MDLQTLNVVILFISLIMAASMFLLHRAIPREDCLRDWALAGLLHLIPAILGLAILAGHSPPWTVVATSNVAYLGGNTFIFVGVRRYLGLRAPVALVFAFLVLIYALNWIPTVRDSFTLRLAAMYALLTLLSLGTALVLLRNMAPGMRVAFATMMVIHLLFVLQSLIRIPIFILTDLRDVSPVSSTFLRTSGCLGTLLFLLLNNMACALLVARRQELSLSEAALRDPLTGWHNRRSLAQHAERRFTRSVRDGSTFGIVTIDIDHFKRINDEHGHAAGDAAIRHLALVSERTLRPQDVLARLGGEEFCALVECDDEASLFQIAERWRSAVQDAPLSMTSHSVAMTVSVGYSMRNALDGAWGDVLQRADAALYSAKNGGRNRVGRPTYPSLESAGLGAVGR